MVNPAQQKLFSGVFSVTRYNSDEFSDSAWGRGDKQGEKKTKQNGGGGGFISGLKS